MSVRQDDKFHSMASEDSKCCGPCRGGCCGRFFQRGRELESIDTNHSYTEEERRDLAKFHSIDYMPCTCAGAFQPSMHASITHLPCLSPHVLSSQTHSLRSLAHSPHPSAAHPSTRSPLHSLTRPLAHASARSPLRPLTPPLAHFSPLLSRSLAHPSAPSHFVSSGYALVPSRSLRSADNSEVYRKWLRKQSPSVQNPGNKSRWIMMFMIGLVVGLVGFLLKSSIFRISNLRYWVANMLLESDNLPGFWLWIIGYSVLIVFISAALVVFIQPAAAASGIPETISYLNGAHVPKIFNIRTMVIKFFSCVCAVGSGLPVGPEGPMIHLGAMLGKGLSQGQSRTMGFATNMFKRFRNMRDRRDFISAGAAAGVASAFGAPVGGLLFSMEEVRAQKGAPLVVWL